MDCRLFRTDHGHIGLAIEDEKAVDGDLICVFWGAQMPFVICKVGEHHVLVGQCYVQRLMRGQGMDEIGDDNIVQFNLK
jgi:hypothetical protein